MAPCTRRLPPPPPPPPASPSVIPHTGNKRDSWLPEPKKEMPIACLPTAIAAADLSNTVKKNRRPVPVPLMTDEERNKIKRLKELHSSVVKDMRELLEERADLRKNYDEFLFWRRCVAARLVNRIVFQRRDAAYVRHQLDIGLKLGDKLPEELKKARQPISKALFMWRDMGRAVQLGMDKFIAENSDPEECRKRIRREWNALAGLDENGVPLNSVDRK